MLASLRRLPTHSINPVDRHGLRALIRRRHRPLKQQPVNAVRLRSLWRRRAAFLRYHETAELPVCGIEIEHWLRGALEVVYAYDLRAQCGAQGICAVHVCVAREVVIVGGGGDGVQAE